LFIDNYGPLELGEVSELKGVVCPEQIFSGDYFLVRGGVDPYFFATKSAPFSRWLVEIDFIIAIIHRLFL